MPAKRPKISVTKDPELAAERDRYLRDLADHDWLDARLDSAALESVERDGGPGES